MTGQISPYYLNETPNQVFGHFLKVSGTVALSGECIAGFHNDGKYYLTKKKDEVSYYRPVSYTHLPGTTTTPVLSFAMD